MTDLNKALIAIPKRAEMRQAEELRATCVDSGIAEAMSTIDHQSLYAGVEALARRRLFGSLKV